MGENNGRRNDTWNSERGVERKRGEETGECVGDGIGRSDDQGKSGLTALILVETDRRETPPRSGCHKQSAFYNILLYFDFCLLLFGCHHCDK
jgi:hypothetical protein